MNLFAPAEIAANYAEAGVKKSSMPVSKMLLLGILAGMLIAFPSCVTNMASYGLDNNSVIRAVSGLLFAFGLGMVILIGAELFTVLEKKVRVTAMLKDWLFVYIGNFIGSMLVAVLCAKFGWLSASGNLLATYAMKVALGKMTMPFQNAFFMGFLCNVLVTIGVLLSLGAKDTMGRFIGAWAPVMFFVTCGFNHSIADMTYCTMGLFAKTVPAYVETAQALGADLSALTWGNYFVGNMLPVTLGNILGGLFVGFTMWFGFLRKAK